MHRYCGWHNIIKLISKYYKYLVQIAFDYEIMIHGSLRRLYITDLVLGPSTALNGLFLEHCTLTDKRVRAIWRTFVIYMYFLGCDNDLILDPFDCYSDIINPLELNSFLDGRSTTFKLHLEYKEKMSYCWYLDPPLQLVKQISSQYSPPHMDPSYTMAWCSSI